MANRRSLQQMMPGMPMTGSGTSASMGYAGDTSNQADPSQQMPIESPETRRRRLAPVLGMPQEQPTTIQQLTSMVRGGQ